LNESLGSNSRSASVRLPLLQGATVVRRLFIESTGSGTPSASSAGIGVHESQRSRIIALWSYVELVPRAIEARDGQGRQMPELKRTRSVYALARYFPESGGKDQWRRANKSLLMYDS